MPILWIHRPYENDFRVQFDSVKDAYDFGKKLLVASGGKPDIGLLDEPLFAKTGILIVGCTETMQISVEETMFKPSEGWHYWNNNGCIPASQEEVERTLIGKEPTLE